MLGLQFGQRATQCGGLAGAHPFDEVHQRRFPTAGVGGLVQRIDHQPGHQFVATVGGRISVGAVVTVRVGDKSYAKVRDGKSGYLSQSLLPLYFGLGDAVVVDQVEVRWPAGHTQIVAGPLEANTLLSIAEE